MRNAMWIVFLGFLIGCNTPSATKSSGNSGSPTVAVTPTSTPISTPTASPTASPTVTPSSSPSPTLETSVSGTAFTCGYTSTGAVYCTGDNTYGQLGDNFAEGSSENWILADSGATRIGAWDNYVCDTEGNNIVKCWGNSLGVATTVYTDANNRINALAVGNNLACFMSNTSATYSRYVDCWTEANGGNLVTLNLASMISYTTNIVYSDNLYVDVSGQICVGIAQYNPSTSTYIAGDQVVCGSSLMNYQLVD